MYSAGFARVLVDGKLVADGWTNWQKGRTFFEEGSDETVGTIALEAGQSYDVVIEFATKTFSTLGLAAFAAGIGLPVSDAAIAEAVRVAAQADTAIIFVGRSGEWDTEGSDLQSITLPGRQDELIAAVARANPRTIVVLQTGGPVEMPWIDDVAAVAQAWYPGQEAGNAIADVLTGKQEPSGRLPQTFPTRWADNPAHSQDREVYPGLEGKVRYEEGIFVGYRHYDRIGLTPLFPFGFGLGYASFSISQAGVDDRDFENNGSVAVSLSVTNTSERPGSAVVQGYVSQVSPSVSRPAKELKAFRKLALQAGETREITLSFNARSFAHFDTAAQCWIVEPGTYHLLIGQSAADLPLSITVECTSQLSCPL